MAEPDTTRPDPADGAEPNQGGGARKARVRFGAVLALLVAAGFIAWAALGGAGSSNSTATTGTTPASSSTPQQSVGTDPVPLSYRGLRTLVRALKQPVFWVGKKPHRTYEFRQTTDGKIYVRYLPPGVHAGDPRTFLTVATYPLLNAFSVTQAAARGGGSTELHAGKSAAAFYGKDSETNAYVAFAGMNYQIEVYSPKSGLARRLVERGAVKSVP
jgi:hypothetical protein